MHAPRPCTPPQPTEPPINQTPRARRRSSVSGSARRQIFPSTSRARTPSDELDYSFEALPQTPPPVEPDESLAAIGGQTEDEDLRDPEFFIRTFSCVGGSHLHSDFELFESLLQKLERYLVKVNRCQDDSSSMPGTSKDKKAGVSNVNFAEAALVVQGSTRIYGKKVDLLFNAAIQLFRLLSSPFENEEEEEEDEGAGVSLQKSKKNKRLRLGLDNRELAEDICMVDNMKEGCKIEQKKSNRPRFAEVVKNLSNAPPRSSIRFLPPNIPRLVRKTTTLGTNQKEVEKINVRRVPQYGLGVESRGFIDEYRLNEVIRRPDSMLVEHFVAPVQEGSKSRAVEGTPQNKGLHPFSQCDSGIDSCPSSVYNPTENMGAHETDSIIWEGTSVGVSAEADALSCADDGFVSEGIHEEGVSEIDEESVLETTKMGPSDDAEASKISSEEANSEAERTGTESSGVGSELGVGDESHPAKLNEEDVENAALQLSADGENSVPANDKESGTPKPSESKNAIASKLKEVEFTLTPRRNKRKLKTSKLPCRISLLIPEKKRKIVRSNRAAELWRPSQSPCSSASSNYPQSPVSIAPTSPDPHSLSQLLLQDGDHHDVDNLSDSENEGEYFDPPADGRPQVNYWIQNHQKDLMSAGEPTTLSDQVAQWQELIMPRLDKNLQYGPYSHVKYAPVLLELLNRKGWPPPQNCLMPDAVQSESSVEVNISEEEDSEEEFELDRICSPSRTRSSSWEDGLHESLLPYDQDFADSREDDVDFDGEHFWGFKVAKKVKRRGIVIAENGWNVEIDKGILFTSLSSVYQWGLGKMELEALDSEKRLKQWHSSKTEWLQSKVRVGESRRNWDEWAEENDNVETGCDLGLVPFADACAGTSQSKEPVLFTSLFSGFRKEEVSRLLFTALHLASQGIVEITSEPGVINSMKLSVL